MLVYALCTMQISMHYVRSCEQCYLTKFKDPDMTDESADDEEEEEEVRPEERQRPSTSEQPAKRSRTKSIINL